VKVNDREIEEMAVYKGMEVSSFKEKFVKESNGELELKKSEKNLSCVFLLDKKCTIYSGNDICTTQ
jgi:Fe-S-cluster containining protein